MPPRSIDSTPHIVETRRSASVFICASSGISGTAGESPISPAVYPASIHPFNRPPLPNNATNDSSELEGYFAGGTSDDDGDNEGEDATIEGASASDMNHWQDRRNNLPSPPPFQVLSILFLLIAGL